LLEQGVGILLVTHPSKSICHPSPARGGSAHGVLRGTRRLYLAYSEDAFEKVDITGDRVEKHFATLAQPHLGLETADEFLLTCDPSGRNTHSIFSPCWQLTSSKMDYYSRGFTWSAEPANVFLATKRSRMRLRWEALDRDGKMLGRVTVHDHGDFPVRHPIRVAPDGSIVVVGNGDVYHGRSLNWLGRSLSRRHPQQGTPSTRSQP
jgi:hypothetical protein